MDKKSEVKKVPMFLFSKEKPKGEMFSFYGGKGSDEYKELLEKGWVDTPARLKLPKEMNTGILADEAVNADPQLLIKILEEIGFFVLSQEQLEAEANKMAAAAIDMDNFSDEDIIKEAERRGLKKSEEPKNLDHLIDSGAGSADGVDSRHEAELDVLQNRFNKEPKELIKDELVKLGNDKFKLGLRSSFNEDTLISKITEAMKGEEA